MVRQPCADPGAERRRADSSSRGRRAPGRVAAARCPLAARRCTGGPSSGGAASMTPGRGRGSGGRIQDCTAVEARTRLRQAKLYLEVAELVLSEESSEAATVAVGNVVLAGIAAADAISCAAMRQRFRGSGHRQAADHLERVTGDPKLGAAPRDRGPEGQQPLRPREPGRFASEIVGAKGRQAGSGRGRAAPLTEGARPLKHRPCAGSACCRFRLSRPFARRARRPVDRCRGWPPDRRRPPGRPW